FYIVTVRVHSHARGRPQSEAGVNASLVDSHSRSYQISEVGQRAYEAEHGPTPPLTDRLQPGQTIESVLVFDVPAGASDIALNLGHNGPGLFIIGDDESALHKPTIIRLNS
ncbi:MAG TPA: hypothetical protein VFW40_10310, partial [Capsulimonadaceae bacterium]|nr:hypothetical protein [Capsulimonadaceae bacterium]